jgi:hypothetical protein
MVEQEIIQQLRELLVLREVNEKGIHATITSRNGELIFHSRMEETYDRCNREMRWEEFLSFIQELEKKERGKIKERRDKAHALVHKLETFM